MRSNPKTRVNLTLKGELKAHVDHMQATAILLKTAIDLLLGNTNALAKLRIIRARLAQIESVIERL